MDDKPPGPTLMLGVVGSRAYGWETPTSDTDLHGVFAMPPDRLLGLHPPTNADNSFRPNEDTNFHEAAHFLRLALRGNPAVLEMLFLPPDLVVQSSSAWKVVRDLRMLLIGAPQVKQAYLGYAREQLRRMGSGSREMDFDKRAKHARHMKRLIDQGFQLYSTGHLTVKVGDREAYFEFGESVAKMPDLGRDFVEMSARRFEKLEPALVGEPREDVANEWLLQLRRGAL